MVGASASPSAADAAHKLNLEIMKTGYENCDSKLVDIPKRNRSKIRRKSSSKFYFFVPAPSVISSDASCCSCNFWALTCSILFFSISCFLVPNPFAAVSWPSAFTLRTIISFFRPRRQRTTGFNHLSRYNK